MNVCSQIKTFHLSMFPMYGMLYHYVKNCVVVVQSLCGLKKCALNSAFTLVVLGNVWEEPVASYKLAE